MHGNTTNTFSLTLHKSTPAHSVTTANGINATAPTLAKFVTAHSDNGVCQNSDRHLGQTATEFTLNKEGVLVRRAAIDGAFQNSCRIQYDYVSSTYHIILLFPVSQNNVVCKKPRKKIFSGLNCLVIGMKPCTTATVVPKTVLHLNAGAPYNTFLQRDRWEFVDIYIVDLLKFLTLPLLDSKILMFQSLGTNGNN